MDIAALSKLTDEDISRMSGVQLTIQKNELAVMIVKALITLNSAGFITVLHFLGNGSVDSLPVLKGFCSLPLISFVVGLTAIMLMLFVNYLEFELEIKGIENRLSWFIENASIFFAISSALAFLAGVWLVALNLM